MVGETDLRYRPHHQFSANMCSQTSLVLPNEHIYHMQFGKFMSKTYIFLLQLYNSVVYFTYLRHHMIVFSNSNLIGTSHP